MNTAAVRPGSSLHDALMKAMIPYLGAHSPLGIISGFLGFILALEGFSWLSDRKAIDFYESQPVSRAAHFRDVTANSFLIYICSLLTTLLVGIAFIAGYGGAGLPLFAEIGKCLFMSLAIFFSCFSLGTLSVMLTGNPIVSYLAAWVFVFYEPVLRVVIVFLKESFFSTYVDVGLFSKGMWTSPFYYYSLSPAKASAANLLLGAVVLAAAYCCYMIRRHERAGQAVVFAPVRTVVRIAMAFLMGLLAGFLFAAGTGKVFGLFCGALMAVIMACVMEIIFAYDFKALFRRFPEIIISVALVICVLLTFLADPFGYDKWIPHADKVADAAVLCENSGSNMYDRDGRRLVRASDYQRDYMHLTDVDAVTALAKYCVEDSSSPSDYNNEFSERMTILYRMNNGTGKLRSYCLTPSVPSELLDPILGSSEFKEGYFSIYADDYRNEAGKTAAFSYSNYFNGTGSKNAEYAAFRKAYIKDLEKFSLSYIRDHKGIGEVMISIYLPPDDGSAASGADSVDLTYPVWEGFDNTIRFLEDTGIWMEPIRAEDISSILISPQFDPDHDGINENEGLPEKTCTDPGQIKELLDHAVIPGRVPFSTLVPTDTQYYLEASLVKGATDLGYSESVSLLLREGEVPAFLQ